MENVNSSGRHRRLTANYLFLVVEERRLPVMYRQHQLVGLNGADQVATFRKPIVRFVLPEAGHGEDRDILQPDGEWLHGFRIDHLPLVEVGCGNDTSPLR